MHKTRKVMDKVLEWDSTVEYGKPDEDRPGRYLAGGVRISLADYKALGSPEQITVTVEPGDVLTEAESTLEQPAGLTSYHIPVEEPEDRLGS